MTKSVQKILFRSCSLVMVTAMACGIAGLQLPDGKVDAAASSGKLVDVSDLYDVSNLRSQYYNSEAVTPNTSVANEERWFFVDLGGSSLMDNYLESGFEGQFSDYTKSSTAARIKSGLERTQRAFLTELSLKGVSYQFKYSYTALTNAVAIKIKNKDVAAVRKMAGVKDVYSSESYGEPKVAVSNNANVYSTGIYNPGNVEYKGEGMAVAILDTGLDYTHDAFSHMPERNTISINSATVDGKLSELEAYKYDKSLKLSDVYYNDKVPYAYDYADKDADVYPSYSNHGTHVAGIVAGRDENKTVNEETGETFIGVAPEAQLVICKVFSDNLDNRTVGNAESVDILAAISDCVTLGVDVINMSLGTTAGFSSEGYATEGDYLVSSIYEKVENAGISLVVAAGNEYSSGYGGDNGTNLASNPDSGTVGSPSTYPSALSVASINGQPANYFAINGDEENVAFFTESSDANGKAYKFLDILYENTGTDKSQPLELDYVVVGGVGRAGNYTTSIKNQLKNGRTVAVIKRGDISFAEKVQNAMANGAVACIIYNHLSGTIRMTLGEVLDPIPSCSISMDAGKLLTESAKGGKGKVTFSYENAAGPFMSDFSSWGPTPDLKLKPEITAHGGEITSAVPGGYAVQSGTSMATPNMSGAIALLRQHVKQTTSLTGKALNDRVYQLLMSTATMARNDSNDPYSPRKQGAGLAGIYDAVNTEGYITVSDGKGGVSDKTKIELGDDPTKKGVYEIKFTVHNQTGAATTYTPKIYVQTESLSTDEKTVAEKAYMLTSQNVVKVGGTTVAEGGKITVPANGEVEVSVSITLDNASRDYLDKTFVNGMYVEGFIRLESDTCVELGIPYLAFYGDWTKAPMFDYTAYEIAASKADSSVEEEDKLKASAASSSPIGLLNDAKYIITLGTYLYDMDSNYTEIPASDERASLSCYDMDGRRTVYQLYMVYAGLLRSAKTLRVEIRDKATGELVYSHEETNVRKSYSAGGSNIGSEIKLGFNPIDWGLSNNSTYEATLKGVLDYENGANNINDTFSFKFTVDTEKPTITDYRLRYEPYTENDETKYRIYMDVDVYDNHYVMSLLPCYINDENDLALLTKNPIPVYSQKGSTTTVSLEVTDYFDDYVKTGKLYLVAEDYAINDGIYNVSAISATEYPTSIELKTDDKLTKADGNKTYTLQLSQYESYKFDVTTTPDTASPASLSFRNSGSVVCNDNEVYALAAQGSGTVTIQDGYGRTLATVNVILSGGNGKPSMVERITLEPILNAGEYVQTLDGGAVSLKPYKIRTLKAHVEPWYCEYTQNIEYEWSSSNESVLTIDQTGTLKTLKAGTAYITVRVKGNGAISKMIRVTVEDEFRVVNNILYDYYGGPDVVIPDIKNILSIDEEAFKDNKEIESVTISKSITSITKNAFQNCTNLKWIYIPAECKLIHPEAFSGCTSLEKIILAKDVDEITKQEITGTLTVGRQAFAGCTSLTTIENPHRLTTANTFAFAGCTSLESIDISGLRISGDFVFANCTKLKEVTTSELTQIGAYMFSGCTSLTDFDFKDDHIDDGAFIGCTNLANIKLPSTITKIGAYAFSGTALNSIMLPNGAYSVGDYAFANCKNLTRVTLSENTKLSLDSAAAFKGCDKFVSFEYGDASVVGHHRIVDGILYSADGKTLECMPVGKAAGEFKVPDGVTRIGGGAFAGSKIKTIDLNGVTEIGAYAFAESSITGIDISMLEVIPEGAFYNCKSLIGEAQDTVVITVNGSGESKIKYIGDYAFAGCYSDSKDALRQTFNLPNAVSIGAHAFERTPIIKIVGDKIESIGEYAFYHSNLHTMNDGDTTAPVIKLPAVTSIGDYAFAGNENLSQIELGAVTEMGIFAFADCGLRRVVFGNGTTVIGDYAFVSEDIFTSEVPVYNRLIADVTIPSTVKVIGEYAFYYATVLSSDNIDLSGVVTIGDFAFRSCEQIAELDLSNVEAVGNWAFSGTSLTEADLQKAKSVGAYAFSTTPLDKLNIPVLEHAGRFAFASTNLTTVTIPATMSSLTYDSEWEREKTLGTNNFETLTGKMNYRYDVGVFAYNSKLTRITVESGNDTFFVENGVLYAKTENGQNVLIQYPANKVGASYTVLDNTVRIADAAFYGTRRLKEIKIPYTVKTIGSYAFLESSVKDFTFESVEAPVLEAEYDLEASRIYSSDETQNAYLDGLFYSNFYSYAAYGKYNNYNFGLTLHIPENGTGYNAPTWTYFFKTVQTNGYAPDETTRKTQDAIDALPMVDAIKAAVNALNGKEAKLAYVKNLSSEQVQAARTLYNSINMQGQRDLISAQYEKLVAIEGLVRELRSQLGDTPVLNKVEVVQNPAKYRYEAGEKFDPTGMVIKAVYDDLSEVILSENDYTIDKTGELTTDDSVVTVTYNGFTAEIRIQVEEKEPDHWHHDLEGLSAGAIAGIVIGSVAGVALIAAVVIIILKKKNK